jgi:hypothetical protein
MRILTFSLLIGVGALASTSLNQSDPAKAVTVEQRRPDLTAIFTTGNYQQWIDRFGTVSRSAFDASGKRIGTQVGHVCGPNGIVVEMTYLVPDAEHPLGQAFDGAGNPMPLHTSRETPDRSQQEPLISQARPRLIPGIY